MRQIREILRLRRQQALSVRKTARALGVSVGVVSKTASRAQQADITWAVAEGMVAEPAARQPLASPRALYGDGRAAPYIVERLERDLEIGE